MRVRLASYAQRRRPEQVRSRLSPELSSRSLRDRGPAVIVSPLRWTPTHKGVEGSEVAGDFAKEVAESKLDAVDRPHLRGASFAHLTKRRPRRGPRARGGGSRSTSRAAGATGHRREEISALACKGGRAACEQILSAPFRRRVGRSLSGRGDSQDSVE